MPKFIVRESSGEFYKAIEAENLEAARSKLGTESAIAYWGYQVETAPEAPMFENSDWLDDWNSPMSRHHY